MEFKITGQNLNGEVSHFLYDNQTNSLKNSDGNEIKRPSPEPTSGTCNTCATEKSEFKPFSIDLPLKKSKKVNVLKIQMGLSCNYSCDYCSQRFVERADETSKKHIDEFLTKLDNLEFNPEKTRIEFWGGEPLVYWKTMKPLAEAIQEKYGSTIKMEFSTITNGSLLTPEICDWLYDMNFSVGLSHDGPGQSVRGPDPFDDPEKKKIILDFYKRMTGRMSFNAMLNSTNSSRKEIHDWFCKLTGDNYVPLGEGSIVDAYDEGGNANMISTKEDHFAFRRTAFSDIFSTSGNIGFTGMIGKINNFINTILEQKSNSGMGQKCGMDDEHTIAVDLRGNVITCQNVSSVSTAGNGESHLAGNIENIDAVKIKTATHWSNRNDCSKCPVLSLCKGSCMYLEGKYWDISCDNAYSDNVALFALSIEKITGFLPVFIDAPHLPDDRKDIFGRVLKHEEKPIRKPFPIKVVAAKKVVDGHEVFDQALR